MLSIQEMGTGTTEQTHRAPALLHTLWAILYRKVPLARGEPHVDAARSSPLTSPFCLGPHRVHRRQLPFHAHCSGGLLCHALTSWLSLVCVTTFRASGSWWVCQEVCPGPSHLGQGASRNKNSWGLNLRISFPLALARPGQAGGHDTNAPR